MYQYCHSSAGCPPRDGTWRASASSLNKPVANPVWNSGSLGELNGKFPVTRVSWLAPGLLALVPLGWLAPVLASGNQVLYELELLLTPGIMLGIRTRHKESVVHLLTSCDRQGSRFPTLRLICLSLASLPTGQWVALSCCWYQGAFSAGYFGSRHMENLGLMLVKKQSFLHPSSTNVCVSHV